MKYLVAFLFTSVVWANGNIPLPHLDLSMTGSEYHNLIKDRDDGEGNHELDPIIKLGDRLFSWLALINQSRPEENKISLSNPENQPAYPIDSPKVSSPKIILKNFNQLKKELPASIAREVTGTHQLTAECLVSDEEFVFWGRKIEEVYGAASRWLLQEPMLWGYAARKRKDIRGYHYLLNLNNAETVLTHWSAVAEPLKMEILNALEGLCFNSEETETQCRSHLEEILKKEGNPLSFFKTYLPAGKARWDELFVISQKRSDVEWNAQSSNLLSTPFQVPESEEILHFLQENIEDEWRWDNWSLRLNFIQGDWSTIHVRFVPGATPNVNGLAGNTITMDANQPLTEYHVRWTIRHEFGHALGFPDCYVEFYEPKTQEMISYQVDTTNLMCSRRGKFQEKHFQELKRVYYLDG